MVNVAGGMRALLVAGAVSGAVSGAGEATAQTQCSGRWISGAGVPSPDGNIYTLVALPDGDILVGGSFTHVGGVSANGVARLDLHTGSWSPLGQGVIAGPSEGVFSICVLQSGDIVVGGEFSGRPGDGFANVACWNGTSWVNIGGGIHSNVEAIVAAMVAMPNGDIIVGGTFEIAGAIRARNIARWNGSGWLPVGAGVNSCIVSLAATAAGEVIAGGCFTAATGIVANRIARWDGNAWNPLGDGLWGGANAFVSNVATLPNGDVLAGGNASFGAPGIAPFLGRWDGQSWSRLGASLPGATTTFLLTSSGRIIQANEGLPNVVALDGAAWASLGTGVDARVFSMVELPGGDLLLGGEFARAGGESSPYLARWTTPGCQGDFNCSGAVTIQDLYDFLYAFFGQRASADISGDGSLGVQDVLGFLAAYLAPCP